MKLAKPMRQRATGFRRVSRYWRLMLIFDLWLLRRCLPSLSDFSSISKWRSPSWSTKRFTVSEFDSQLLVSALKRKNGENFFRYSEHMHAVQEAHTLKPIRIPIKWFISFPLTWLKMIFDLSQLILQEICLSQVFLGSSLARRTLVVASISCTNWSNRSEARRDGRMRRYATLHTFSLPIGYLIPNIDT